MQATFTIGQANSYLEECGFNVRLGPEMAQRIKAVEPMDRFAHALRRGARGDRGAREWLKSVLKKSRINPDEQRSLSEQSELALDARTDETLVQRDLDEKLKQRSLSVHVYGKRAALCFDADETRNRVATVALDAAPSDTDVARRYAWANKIRIQFTQKELPVVAAVLLGHIPRCEYHSHGPNHNKGFSMENQGQRVFVKVWGKDRGMQAVPIESHDLFAVSGLVLCQLARHYAGLDGHMVLAMLHALARCSIASENLAKRDIANVMEVRT